MPSLWSPTNWPDRLAELQANSPDLKEAPLRRDVRSLGTLLGNVLREQAGEPLYKAVEDLRRTARIKLVSDAIATALRRDSRVLRGESLRRNARSRPQNPV